MIGLHIERTYRPGVGFTDATDFLFEKRGEFPDQNLFPVFGAPDKMVSQLVGDVFGVLYIHTRQYNKCSSLEEVPVGAGYPCDSSRGIRPPYELLLLSLAHAY